MYIFRNVLRKTSVKTDPGNEKENKKALASQLKNLNLALAVMKRGMQLGETLHVASKSQCFSLLCSLNSLLANIY